jgi:phenylalanyl-tRNA synthetase beta chain
MRLSYQWLLELTGLDWSVEEVAERLTLCGTACEDIQPTARYMNNVVVGEVIKVAPIKGADKIRLATVNIGSETLDVVCGAPNVAEGQKVAVATLGAELNDGLVIKKTKIRGIESTAMICAEDELGISDDHTGIMVLPDNVKPGRPLADALDFTDYIMGFELTPNRADSMSAIGIARDLAALAGVKLRYPEVKLNESSERTADHFSVEIDDPEACGRFTSRLIRNIKLGPSPWWLQKRLLTCGMRPINNVVDITNFVMLETGNPLHGFDLKQFGSDRVVVRRAKNGEPFITLDEKEHKLSDEILLVTNGQEAVAAAGIMGGLKSGVSEGTTTLMLEAAWFDSQVIRRGRRCMNMITESSQRFEKGVDPNNVPTASARAAQLFQELCGGEVLSGLVDNYPRPLKPTVISMRPARCNRILGTELGAGRMKDILNGLEIVAAGDDPVEATVPSFRRDITLEIDLIEEVGRMEGYDRIPDADINRGSLYTPLHRVDRFHDELRQLTAAAGYDEMIGHGLSHSSFAGQIDPDLPQLRIINPVAEDLDIMRNSLLVSALPVVAHNIAHRALDLRLFEIGKAYLPGNDSENTVEPERLILLVTGSTEATWRDKPRPHDLYDLTGALKRLADHFHWPPITFAPNQRGWLDEGTSIDVSCGDRELGWLGKLNGKLSTELDIKQDVFLAELDVASLLSLSDESVAFTALPVYPAATRDIAMILDEQVRVGDVLSMIRDTAGDLAEKVSLFDLYKGKQIAKGRKSIAVSIRYRSPERSLASEEIDRRQAAVMDMLRREFKVEIRDA